MKSWTQNRAWVPWNWEKKKKNTKSKEGLVSIIVAPLLSFFLVFYICIKLLFDFLSPLCLSFIGRYNSGGGIEATIAITKNSRSMLLGY